MKFVKIVTHSESYAEKVRQEFKVVKEIVPRNRSLYMDIEMEIFQDREVLVTDPDDPLAQSASHVFMRYRSRGKGDLFRYFRGIQKFFARF